MDYRIHPTDHYTDNEDVSRGIERALQAFVNQLPLLPPTEISQQLEALGYKGQIAQRSAVSLFAYRHIRRETPLCQRRRAALLAAETESHDGRSHRLRQNFFNRAVVSKHFQAAYGHC
ncbi:MAG: hypothetical protein HY231_19510 [Acidobacteria bacterium]|nr:hypothetical protein [Acidobacteriota bacterium]